jgi:hypothetical protein
VAELFAEKYEPYYNPKTDFVNCSMYSEKITREKLKKSLDEMLQSKTAYAK